MRTCIGTCPFGVAHVDTPKGDLNVDGKISGPDITVIENHYVYPFGKFQYMCGYAIDLSILQAFCRKYIHEFCHVKQLI